MSVNAEHVEVASRAEWRAWLAEHHGRRQGIWLVFHRKGDPRHLTYEDIVEEALCFGWVDSRPGMVDAVRTKLFIAPRKPGSAWSGPNKTRVARLIEAGLMMPSGLARVEEAQRNGLWTKLDAVEALEMPDDLAEALATLPPARANWDAFPRSARRGILEWIIQAKRPETRAARIAETARLAAINERANQWKPKG